MLAKPRWMPVPTRPEMEQQTEAGKVFKVDY